MKRFFKNKYIRISCIFASCALVLCILSIFFTNQNPLRNFGQKKLVIGTTTINLEIADTSEKQELGLGVRDSLSSDSAMLFVFDHPDMYGIWMKSMKFPIDIFWLDDKYKIISLQENVSENTYPQVFYPKNRAWYVVETNAGFANMYDLKPDMTLDIEGV